MFHYQRDDNASLINGFINTRAWYKLQVNNNGV